jgi:hypothetical protein
VRGLPRHGRGRRPQAGRRSGLGPAHQDRLRRAAELGPEGQGREGGGEFSDLEIGRAVVYLANQGGAKFDEPKAPAAAASAASAASN